MDNIERVSSRDIPLWPKGYKHPGLSVTLPLTAALGRDWHLRWREDPRVPGLYRQAERFD